jgi:hypothetical protein
VSIAAYWPTKTFLFATAAGKDRAALLAFPAAPFRRRPPSTAVPRRRRLAPAASTGRGCEPRLEVWLFQSVRLPRFRVIFLLGSSSCVLEAQLGHNQGP